MMDYELTELIARAHWREAVTYRETWPHEYVLAEKDGQQELLEAVSERVMRHEAVRAEAKSRLSEHRATLDPVALLQHSIRETQSALAAIVSPEVRPTPLGESLERFLTRLPGRWRQDEVSAWRMDIGEGLEAVAELLELLAPLTGLYSGDIKR